MAGVPHDNATWHTPQFGPPAAPVGFHVRLADAPAARARRDRIRQHRWPDPNSVVDGPYRLGGQEVAPTTKMPLPATPQVGNAVYEARAGRRMPRPWHANAPENEPALHLARPETAATGSPGRPGPAASRRTVSASAQRPATVRWRGTDHRSAFPKETAPGSARVSGRTSRVPERRCTAMPNSREGFMSRSERATAAEGRIRRRPRTAQVVLGGRPP